MTNLNFLPILLSQSQSTNQIIFDSTINLPLILALCALAAPCLTALINNIYHYYLRKLELDYDLNKHLSEIQYRDKYAQFTEFVNVIGKYTLTEVYNPETTNQVLYAIRKALVSCSPDTRKLLLKLQDSILNQKYTSHEEYIACITVLIDSINNELCHHLRVQNSNRK